MMHILRLYDISPLSVRLSLSRLLALAACTAAVPLPSIFCLLTEDNKKNTASHSLTALTIFFSCTVAQPALSAGTRKSKSTNIAWEVNHSGTIVFFYKICPLPFFEGEIPNLKSWHSPFTFAVPLSSSTIEKSGIECHAFYRCSLVVFLSRPFDS